MIDFLFTNKRLKNFLNYENKFGNFFFIQIIKQKLFVTKIVNFFYLVKFMENLIIFI